MTRTSMISSFRSTSDDRMARAWDGDPCGGLLVAWAVLLRHERRDRRALAVDCGARVRERRCHVAHGCREAERRLRDLVENPELLGSKLHVAGCISQIARRSSAATSTRSPALDL